MKKKWINPVVSGYKLEDGGDDSWTGDGSGMGTPDIEPWDWEFWSANFEEDDSDGDGIPGTWGDYVAWMINHGFESYINPEEEPRP